MDTVGGHVSSQTPIGPLSPGDGMLVSLFSTAWARAICMPFDVVRVMQQVEPRRILYVGTFPTIGQLYRDEGTRAFVKGTAAGVWHSAIFGGSRMALAHSPQAQSQLPLVSALGAGLAATAIAHPLDVIATRMIIAQPLDTVNFVYARVGFTAKSIVKREGLRGLYRGFSPALLFFMAFEASALGFYRSTRSIELLAETHPVVAGLLAATIGQTVAYPFDVVKRRLQAQHAELPNGDAFYSTRYSSTFDCIRKTVQADGARALYRGLGVTICKILPFVGIQFALYESLKRLYILWDTNQLLREERRR